MAAILCMYKIEHRMQICLRNQRIACSTDHVSNTVYSWKKPNLNLKDRDDILKSKSHPRSMYSSRPTQPHHFQADLIWCDGTFKQIWWKIAHYVAFGYKFLEILRGNISKNTSYWACFFLLKYKNWDRTFDISIFCSVPKAVSVDFLLIYSHHCAAAQTSFCNEIREG
jgi:hypothetical protein